MPVFPMAIMGRNAQKVRPQFLVRYGPSTLSHTQGDDTDLRVKSFQPLKNGHAASFARLLELGSILTLQPARNLNEREDGQRTNWQQSARHKKEKDPPSHLAT